MKKIFLSASIPSPLRDKRYYDTADFIAIREAIRALAMVVIPKTILVWGGHPAITPIISNVLQAMNSDIQKHVIMYQSRFFEGKFPKENSNIGQIVLTDTVENDRNKSLLFMRQKMIKENDYIAGVFIGGMDGVEEEFDIFSKEHADSLFMPIATTGAAAKIIYEKKSNSFDKELATEYAYRSLFSKKIKL